MPKIENGAELCHHLAKSGTGQTKLDFLESVLRRIWKDSKEPRIATSNELIKAMEAHSESDQWDGTLQKMRNLAEYGTIEAPEAVKDRRFWEQDETKAAADAEDKAFREAIGGATEGGSAFESQKPVPTRSRNPRVQVSGEAPPAPTVTSETGGDTMTTGGSGIDPVKTGE